MGPKRDEAAPGTEVRGSVWLGCATAPQSDDARPGDRDFETTRLCSTLRLRMELVCVETRRRVVLHGCSRNVPLTTVLPLL